MTVFTAAHAGGDWALATKACLEQLARQGGNGDAPTLGFLYLSDALADQASSVLALLRGATGIEHWVGSVGLGVAGSGKEYFDEKAIAVLTAALPMGSFRVFGTVRGDLAEFRAHHGAWIEDTRPALGIVHADPRNPRAAEIVRALAEESGSFLIGGLAASRGAMPQIADEITDGGVSGVLLSPDVAVVTGLSQGYAPIGPVHTVTAGEHNVVKELDGKPAMDIFKAEIGEALARNLARAQGQVNVALPLPGSDTGDYTVRNLVGIDPGRGWIAIGDAIEKGQRLLFVRRDAQAAQSDLRRMLRAVKKRAGGDARGALYFTCVARGPNLFGPGSVELGIVREEIGSVPLAGVFCNGEISNQHLYGYTAILALFL